MQEKKADLHVHTFLSDSTFSPEEVVKEALKRGFSAIAITDHDVVDGIEPAMAAGKKLGVEVIPGVEITAEVENSEIHILGYYIDWKVDWFQQKLKALCQMRVDRTLEMLKRLKEFGIDIDPDEVLKKAGFGSVSRLHLAQFMVEKGHVPSLQHAFRKYIGDRAPCYVKKFNATAEEVIKIILKIGGIPVLAHPGVMGKDKFIPAFVNAGLMGIEAYHSDHPSAVCKHYIQLARRYNLLVTGGSDCHGFGKGEVLMGTVEVPYELVENLKAAWKLMA